MNYINLALDFFRNRSGRWSEANGDLSTRACGPLSRRTEGGKYSFKRGLLYLSIFATLCAHGMKSQITPQISNKLELLSKYRSALLEFELTTKEKPFKEIKRYTLAYPEDRYSGTMDSFVESYLNEFAQSAYALRNKNVNGSTIGNELLEAFDRAIEDEESLCQLIQMHAHVKEQFAKAKPAKAEIN